MNLPVLYSFRRCPYAMRARLALRVAGVPYELREVALKAKPAAMLALSPKATVPVLQLPDGSVLEESLDIMAWALAQSDPEGWLAQGSPEEAQALIERNDGPFKHLLDRYKYANRHPEVHGRTVPPAGRGPAHRPAERAAGDVAAAAGRRSVAGRCGDLSLRAPVCRGG